MKKFLSSLLINILLLCGVSYAQTFYFWRYQEAATDCTALTGGKKYDLCKQLSDNSFYQCVPSSGDCDTVGEWKKVTGNLSSNPAACSAGQFVTDIAADGTLTCGTPAGAGDITDVMACTSGNCNAVTAASGDSLNMAAGDSSIPFPQSTTLPSTCTEGMMYQDTDSGGSETYVCTATDTWTKLSASGDLGSYVLKAGDTMTGALNFNGVANDITTTSSQDLSLIPGGNVGVGLTNPSQKLEVNGIAKATDFKVGSTSVCLADGTNCPSLAAAGGWTDDGTTVRLTTSTDNVGIGTTAPTQQLTLTSNIKIGGDKIFMATNTSGAVLVADGTNFNPAVMSGDVVIATNGVTTIQPNAVALSTDTTGAYLADAAGTTNEISVSGTGAEGATATISLASTVNLTSHTLRIPNSTSLPGTCAVGDMYMDTDATSGQRLYLCQSTNTWVVQGDGTGSSDAPVDATYITQTSNSTLTNEQALSSLSTGIMRVATTTGVVTSLTDSAGIAANIGDETGSGSLVFATTPTIVGPVISTTGATFSGAGVDITTGSGEHLDIAPNGGNVGIATSTPSEKLEVNGNVKALNFLVGSVSVCLADGTNCPSTASAGGWTDDGAIVRLTTGTDNVGIGNTAPNQKLTVTGNENITGNLGIGYTAPGAALAVNGNIGVGKSTGTTALDVVGTGTFSVDVVVGGSSVCLANGTNCPSVASAGGWTDGGTTVLLTTTTDNVGIGVSAIAANNKLQVGGNATISGNIGIGLTNPAQSIDTTGDLRIGGDDLFMATNTSGFMLVADGTNYNPVAMSGDVNIDSTGATTIQANAVALSTDTTGNYVATVAGTTNEIGVSGSGSEGAAVTVSLPSTIVLSSKTVRIPNATTLPATCTVGDEFMDNDATAGLNFYLCTSTNTFTLQGDGGGGSTPAPVDATYITQTANSTLTNEQALSSLSTGIMRVATTTGVVTSLTDSAGIAANISDETGTGALVFGSSPTLASPTIGTGAAVFSGLATDITTSSGENLNIAPNSGNVGVATSTPSEKLEVNGNVKASNFLVGSVSVCLQDGTNCPSVAAAGGWTDDGTVVRQTTSTDNVGIGTTAPASKVEIVGALTLNGQASDILTPGSDHLNLVPGGNVGIAISAPTQKLEVNGTVKATDFKVGTNSLCQSDGTNCPTITTGGGWTDDGTTVRLTTSSDNVGIGTTAPASALQVVGTLTLSGGSTDITTVSNQDLNLAPNGTGNVGVGQSAPAQALDVTGNIRSSGDLYVAGDDIFMGTNTSGMLLIADGTNFNPTAMSGDITINGSGATTIGAGKVTPTMLSLNNSLSDQSCFGYDQTSGQFIMLTCGGGSGSPGGSDTQVQFNDSSAFGGDAGLTYNKTTDALTIAGNLTVDTTTFRVDATNNRIGVGTTAPTQAIDTTGNIRVGGDKIFMATNTSGAILVADGTNYNPVVMSGDVVVATNGATTIQPNAVALSTDTTGNYVATASGTTNEIAVSGSGSEGAAITISLPSTLVLSSKTVRIPSSTTLPATCTQGDEYMDTDATVGQNFYLCTSTDTWTLQGDGTGGGSGTVNSGVAKFYGRYPSTGTTIDDSAVTMDDGTNVGIGTSTPGQKLEINGSIKITGDKIYMNTNTSGDLLVADGTNYNPVAMSGDVAISSTGATTIQANAVALSTDTTGNYLATAAGTSNEISVSGGGSEGATATIALASVVDLTSHTLRVPNSTTLPGTCTVGDLYDDSDATSGARLYLCESTNTFAVVGSGGGASGWTDDGTTVRLTTSTDNVGIGTTAPASALQVAGTLTLSGQATDITTVSNQHLNLAPNGSGNVGIGKSAPGAKLGVGGDIISDGSGIQNNFGLGMVINEDGDGTSLGVFRVEGDTNANLIRTDPANNRVGIGLSTPGLPLDVAIDGSGFNIALTDGSINTGLSGVLGVPDTSFGLLMESQSGNGGFQQVGVGTSTDVAGLSLIGMSKTSATQGGIISLLAAIDTAGTLTAPASGDNVFTITATDLNATFNNVFYIKGDGTIGLYSTKYASCTLTTDSGGVVTCGGGGGGGSGWTTGTGTVYTATSTDNVGIGTSAPATKLELSFETASANSSDSALTITHTTSGTATVGLGHQLNFRTENSGGSIVNSGYYRTAWTSATAGAEYSSFGIGVMRNGSMIEPLGVFGNSGLHWNEGSLPISVQIETDNDANALYVNGSTDNVGIGTGSPGTKLQVVGALTLSGATSDITTGTNEHLNIAPNGTGNVGIATSAPSSKLHVVGNVLVEGHLETKGTAPSLSSCGSSPSVTGNDNAFTITGGTGATACTATFATAFTNTPHCVVSYQTGSLESTSSYTESTTAVTITNASLGTGVVDVLCVGHK